MYNRQWACCRTRRGGWFTLQHEPIYVAALQPGILGCCQSAAFVKWQIVLRDVSSDENIVDRGLRGDIVRAGELMQLYLDIRITRIRELAPCGQKRRDKEREREREREIRNRIIIFVGVRIYKFYEKPGKSVQKPTSLSCTDHR